MDYQRTQLPSTKIGLPGPVPAELRGLTDASLADLSASIPDAATQLGYAGQGFLPVVRTISALAFKQRLTAIERMAIRAASATDPVITDFLDLLDTPGEGLIHLDYPDTVAGVAYLVSHNLLTADRAAALRA
jgi:hypothetical protein